MQLPNVIHPVTFNQSGAHFRVATYSPVSTEQARAIVIGFLRTHRGKFQRGKTYTVLYNDQHGVFF
jgi:hypothetical protein